ncbi:MAG: lysophospholipid acyltransferase family protein [Phycisphaerales bacterium]
MAKASAPFTQFAQYAALRAVAGFMHIFPPRANLHTADAVGGALVRLGPKRFDRAVANLRASFLEWPEERVQACARASIRNRLRLYMVDSLVMPRLVTPASWPAHVAIGEVRAGLDVLLAERHAIFLTGHFGNWELLGFLLATIGYPLTAVARPLDNRWIDRWLLGVREARGMRVLTKWGVTSQIQEIFERPAVELASRIPQREGIADRQGAGRIEVDGLDAARSPRDGRAAPGRVAFIADQNAGDDGLFVPFFGRLASCYKSIGLLAMRYSTPIVCGAAVRIGDDFRFRLELTDVIEPRDWVDRPDPLFYITARYARALETMVRSAPEQYLWIHRRWKSRPRFERDGLPMPASLRRKLESLPWMTDDELVRLAGAAAGATRSGAYAPA